MTETLINLRNKLKDRLAPMLSRLYTVTANDCREELEDEIEGVRAQIIEINMQVEAIRKESENG